MLKLIKGTQDVTPNETLVSCPSLLAKNVWVGSVLYMKNLPLPQYLFVFSMRTQGKGC